MKYLLDTNVLSELRKIPRGAADPNVMAWASDTSVEDYWVSVVNVFEIKMGILQLQRRDPLQADVLERWLETLIEVFSMRILTINLDVALHAAVLHIPDPKPERDALLAATAAVHGLTVVTRNVADFVNTGVELVNPWLNPIA